jgi:serine phosphatase RsbU (regulator of sigma subunit)/pSer/pThr/pTyr-binding forkhead associated (FHA) protein
MPSTHSTPSQREPERGGWAAQKAVLEISLLGGPSTRWALSDSPVVLGRVHDANIQLDHYTVSRRHAEMFCDPFGRWWIRDLGSTNGTQVGGLPLSDQERRLSPGDRIGIGDYVLDFDLERDKAGPDSLTFSAIEDDKPTVIRALTDLEPPRIAAGHLRTLLDFSRKLQSYDDAEGRRAALCELLIGNEFCATLACIVRVKGSRQTIISGPHRPGRTLREGRPYISGTALDRVRETRQAVLATNVTSHTSGPHAIELSIAREVMELWVIACPISFDGDAMDVLYTYIPRDCGSAEWLNLFALAAEVFHQGEAASAARKDKEEHHAIERELETARQIQHELLPRRLGVPSLEVAVGFLPCKWVGGDYVDVVHLPDGRLLLAVADVCGKGLQAALVGSSLHTIVRATADSAPPLPDLVERVNRHLCDWLPTHSFVTLVAAVVDPRTGALECVNAGHPPPLIVDRRGVLRPLQEAENPALGIAPVPFTSKAGQLTPGDVLVMYTDGLTELRNESRVMLGQHQLGQYLSRACVEERAQPIDAVGAALNKQLDQFRGAELPEDDRTFLLARCV